MKIKGQKQNAPAEVDEVETSARDAILDVEKSINSCVVNRGSAVRALLLAIISEQHLLLEGPPGVAKSMIGQLFAASVTGDDFVFFETQMMKSTLPEQLFGPIHIGKMRADPPVYEYATSDMFPKAHFAIIEEVYRASDMVLSAMLTVLNERKFHNGGKLQPCPLITAIGTTNFTTDTDESEAFNDRWLFHCRVSPLSSTDARKTMMRMYLDRTNKPLDTGITLNQIKELHLLRRQVKIPAQFLDMYAEIIAIILTRTQGSAAVLSKEVTDRRYAQTLDVIRSNAVLRGSDSANEDDLFAAYHGLVCVGNDNEEAVFGEAYKKVVGDFQATASERKQLEVLDRKATQLEEAFDTDMTVTAARKLKSAATRMFEAMSNRSTPYVSEMNETEYRAIHARVERVMRSAAEVENSK